MNSFDTLWHKQLRRPYKLHVYDHGGSGPIIVFLHGLASSSANWDLLIPLLKNQYRCISIDLLGFGNSPKPQWYGYTMEDHLRSVHRTIRSLRLPPPFTLVGHSLGSLLATRYTRQHEKSVSCLVLLSPPAYPSLASIRSKAARGRTALFLKLYKFLRTHHRATPDNFARLNRMLPLPKSLKVNAETWIPFSRTLEHCIEQQTLIEDIIGVRVPIDIFYGLLDSVIIPYNIRQLESVRGVSLHPLRVDHNISKRYATAVADVLLNSKVFNIK